MTINLTPEQESRLQAIMSRGAYASVEEVVEAALTAVEQRTLPGFAGTPDELDALLAEGLASGELAEKEFWNSVNQQTNALLTQHKSGQPS
jgi:Arc/MetJ-type ribon-helix-helix transcriptional regulator